MQNQMTENNFTEFSSTSITVEQYSREIEVEQNDRIEEQLYSLCLAHIL